MYYKCNTYCITMLIDIQYTIKSNKFSVHRIVRNILKIRCTEIIVCLYVNNSFIIFARNYCLISLFYYISLTILSI